MLLRPGAALLAHNHPTGQLSFVNGGADNDDTRAEAQESSSALTRMERKGPDQTEW